MHALAVGLMATMVGLVIFLLLEVNHPFRGEIAVTKDNFENALTSIRRSARANRSDPQTVNPRARSCSRPSSVILSGPTADSHPVDLDLVDQAGADQGGHGLILDDVRQRAGRRGQRHVDEGDRAGVALLHADPVHQTEVNDVDAEFWVDDVAHRLLEVGQHLFTNGCIHFPSRFAPALRGHFPSRFAPALRGHFPSRFAPALRARSSPLLQVLAVARLRDGGLKASHPSSAHFTRAGYFATPAKATPSPKRLRHRRSCRGRTPSR